VNDLTNSKKTALHLIAECNHASAVAICLILLENNIDFNALDSASNTGRFKNSLFPLQKGIRIYPSTVSVPYRTVPYRIVPYPTVPYPTVPYRTVAYRTLPFSVRDRFGRPCSVPYFFDRFP
jgi:hypothetical protein